MHMGVARFLEESQGSRLKLETHMRTSSDQVCCRYIACMNSPGGGKNDIPNRLKRQFAIFNVPEPSGSSISHIFGSFVKVHISLLNGSITQLELEMPSISSTLNLDVLKRHTEWPFGHRRNRTLPLACPFVWLLHDASYDAILPTSIQLYDCKKIRKSAAIFNCIVYSASSSLSLLQDST